MADVWMKVRGCCNDNIGLVFEALDEMKMPVNAGITCVCGTRHQEGQWVLMYEDYPKHEFAIVPGHWVLRDFCIKLPPLEDDERTIERSDVFEMAPALLEE